MTTMATNLATARALGWQYQPSALPSTCLNDTVVCIATGASLTSEDVDYARGKATVIVVNDAWRLAPWAAILYSSDRYWYRFHRCAPAFKGLKVTIEFSPGRKALDLQAYAKDMLFMKQTGHDGLEVSRTGLRTCGANSGGAALNLAAHLNPKRIALLGYDCGAVSGKRHFFGDHPRGLSNTHNYPTWRRCFDSMAKPFESIGIDVVNCSRQTSLSAFRQSTIREVL